MSFKRFIIIGLIVLAFEGAVLAAVLMLSGPYGAGRQTTVPVAPTPACRMIWHRGGTLWPKRTYVDCPERIYYLPR